VEDEPTPTFVHEVVVRFAPGEMTDLDALAQFGRETALRWVSRNSSGRQAGKDTAAR
jgi:hypothetical protein